MCNDNASSDSSEYNQEELNFFVIFDLLDFDCIEEYTNNDNIRTSDYNWVKRSAEDQIR